MSSVPERKRLSLTRVITPHANLAPPVSAPSSSIVNTISSMLYNKQYAKLVEYMERQHFQCDIQSLMFLFSKLDYMLQTDQDNNSYAQSIFRLLAETHHPALSALFQILALFLLREPKKRKKVSRLLRLLLGIKPFVCDDTITRDVLFSIGTERQLLALYEFGLEISNVAFLECASHSYTQLFRYFCKRFEGPVTTDLVEIFDHVLEPSMTSILPYFLCFVKQHRKEIETFGSEEIVRNFVDVVKHQPRLFLYVPDLEFVTWLLSLGTQPSTVDTQIFYTQILDIREEYRQAFTGHWDNFLYRDLSRVLVAGILEF